MVRGTVRRRRAFAVFALDLRAGTAANLQRGVIQIFVLLLRMATATGRLVYLLGPARRLTGIGSTSGFTAARVVIATTVRRRRRRSRRQILGSVTVVGMMTITHMLLKALWFDHAAADITDDCIERICFGTQSVQTHVGPVQSHYAALWSISRRITAHGLVVGGRR